MLITLPQVFSELPSVDQVTATIPANTKRVDVAITLVSGGPFYIKRGTGATSANFTDMLTVVGQTVRYENYRGVITLSPTPTTGQINVAEGLPKVGGLSNIY
jgi:hypothetical protein